MLHLQHQVKFVVTANINFKVSSATLDDYEWAARLLGYDGNVSAFIRATLDTAVDWDKIHRARDAAQAVMTGNVPSKPSEVKLRGTIIGQP